DFVADDLIKGVVETLEGEQDWPLRVKETELLLKTDRHEYFNRVFNSVSETIQFLIMLQEDSKDLRGRLG
ncbi:MAG: hypothetical protein AB1744_07240, partial [Candidatus Zixiibacteriota bacterium]